MQGRAYQEALRRGGGLNNEQKSSIDRNETINKLSDNYYFFNSVVLVQTGNNNTIYQIPNRTISHFNNNLTTTPTIELINTLTPPQL